MSDKTPFYANTENNTSVPVEVSISRDIEIVKKSVIAGRKEEMPDVFISSTSGFGFPGIPFVPGEPNPPTFCQGEDVIFDAFLFNEGEVVVPEKFNIIAQVKGSTRSTKFIWKGVVGDGVYPEQEPGYYTVWITAEETKKLFAGSYILNVFLYQSIGKGSGHHDRKISLIDTMFNIDYCGNSENPENVRLMGDLPNRNSLTSTWPNNPDIIKG
jgi:hypothetical protein